LRQAVLGVAFALALTLAAVSGCRGGDKPRRVLAEEEHLLRQVEDLRLLVARAERGSLVPTSGLVVVVDEGLAEQIVQLTLPREHTIERRFAARIERAVVRFSEGHGLVQLHGRVRWLGEGVTASGDVSADLTILARVGAVRADPSAGTIKAEVSPFGFEIHELRIGEKSPATRRFVEGLAAALPGALSSFTTALTLPVAVEHQFLLPKMEAGVLRIPEVSVSVRGSVVEAEAHGGRLWIALRLDVGIQRRADR
jgi:hypothetical protein